MSAERKFLPTLMRLAVVLAPLLVASLFWAYRYHTSSARPAKAVTGAQSSASPSKSQQTAPIDEELSNAERAITFSIAPLTSLSAMMTPADPIRSRVPPAHCDAWYHALPSPSPRKMLIVGADAVGSC